MSDFNNPPVLDIQDEPQNIAGAESYAQKNHNWYELRQYGSSLGTWAQEALDSYDTRFNNMIANTEKVNEVVDARTDAEGQVFGTLSARLNYIQNPFILQISGLVFEGKNYPVISAFKYNYGAGYAQTDNITIDDVEQVRTKLISTTSSTFDLYVEDSALLVTPELSYSSDGKTLYLIDETNNKNIAVYIQNDCTLTGEKI